MISVQIGRQAVFVLMVSACTPANVPLVADDPLIALGDIETTTSGRCYARAQSPTTTRVVDEQVLVVPEVRDNAGTLTSPAVYRNISRPEIVSTGEGVRFEALCPPQFTSDRVATLQRALKARGAYDGPISATIDPATNDAVRAFQKPRGLDSPIISLQNAKELGLVARTAAELANG